MYKCSWLNLIITNAKFFFDIMSLSSGNIFGVFWGLFWHITSILWKPFNMFCEILYRRSWCSFWASLHYFFYIMTLMEALGSIFELILGNVYLILHNCSIFSNETLYRCSWYNYDGLYTKSCFLYHVPRGSFLHIFLNF